MFSGKPNLTLVPNHPAEPVPGSGAQMSGDRESNAQESGNQQSGAPVSSGNSQLASPLSVESLYHSYRHSLLNYLTGLLPGGRQDALEILHETYVRLLRQKDLERLQENPRAYIFTVATNLVRDSLRRRTSRMTDAHIDFDELEYPSDASTPTEAFAWDQTLTRMKRSLMDLPVITRQIFLLSRFEELTYPEIAQALDVSTRTVERHMSTAIKTLQLSLEDLL